MQKVLILLTALLVLGAGCAKPPKTTVTESLPQAVPAAAPAAETVTETVETAPTSTETETASQPAPTQKQTAPKPAPKPAPKQEETTPAPKTHVVTITDSGFSPQIIAVAAGDKVTWVNKGASSHTSVFSGALLWDSGNIPPGGSYTRTFSAAGSYNYHCGAHPTTMKGTVIVR